MPFGTFSTDEYAEITHDLRAPLSVATGYLQMLRDGTFGRAPDAWEEPLDVLGRKIEETRLVVDEILFVARLARTDTWPTLVTIDLVDAARSAVHRAQPRARLLRGTVELDPTSAPVLAMGEEHRLVRILDNLINNALLHSGDHPCATIRVERGERPQVVVEDRGPGVPDHLRDRIFKRFASRERSSRESGGLGLSLSRKLARQMQGELLLEARRQLGSRFVLRLGSA